MYQDSELIKCEVCSGLGVVANNYYGNPVFHHKIPSQLSGYFTFTLAHTN